MKAKKIIIPAIAGICISLAIYFHASKTRYERIIEKNNNFYTMTAYLDGFHWSDMEDRAREAAEYVIDNGIIDEQVLRTSFSTFEKIYGVDRAAEEIHSIYTNRYDYSTWSQKEFDQKVRILKKMTSPSLFKSIREIVINDNSRNYAWMVHFIPIDRVLIIFKKNGSNSRHYPYKWITGIQNAQLREQAILSLSFADILNEGLASKLSKQKCLELVNSSTTSSTTPISIFSGYRFLVKSNKFSKKEIAAYVREHMRVFSPYELMTVYNEGYIGRPTLETTLKGYPTAQLNDKTIMQKGNFQYSYLDYLKIVISSVKNADDYFEAENFIHRTANEEARETLKKVLYEQKYQLLKMS